MDFKVGVGKSDFADLRNSDNYYVDKTEILYELVHETDNKVTLFTRPRRFGKSNREIASIFEDTVLTYFKNTIDSSTQNSMMEALWKGDEGAASRLISDLLWKTISYNDYHEDYYHAFLTGAFVGLGYEVESNKEKGLGRPEILLKDDDNRRAIIIEASMLWNCFLAETGRCKEAVNAFDGRGV